ARARRGLAALAMVFGPADFGPIPVSHGPAGPVQNRHAFSLWIAGGGFKRGYAHGATDEFGYKSVQDVVHVPDMHATLLHSLGLDHERLTYPHAGREDSLTDAGVTKARLGPGLLA